MRRASLAARIALITAATGGAIVACYDKVPGPSSPLPPTKEVQGLAPKPNKVTPNVVEMQTEIGAAGHADPVADPNRAQRQAGSQEPAPVPPPTTPSAPMNDAGVNDVIDLPPVPDSAVPLDAPGVNKR